jgi:FAD/FMN-containing dehydrogenase
MNNEPVAWMNKDDSSLSFKNHGGGWQPLYTHQYERPHNTVLVPCDKLAEMQAEIEALKKEAALQRLSDFTQEAECKHGVDDGACKECYQEATKPVAWIIDAKMTDCDDNFIWNTGNYPDWQVKHWIPLYTHPAKELHLSLQKSKQTGELLAVTYTDDEHRIVEVLWQRPPELTDEEIVRISETCDLNHVLGLIDFGRAILRKASEK